MSGGRRRSAGRRRADRWRPHKTAIEVIGRDVVLRFATVNGQTNRVESASDPAPTSVGMAVPGARNVRDTGSVVQVMDIDGAIHPQLFYRIRRLP